MAARTPVSRGTWTVNPVEAAWYMERWSIGTTGNRRGKAAPPSKRRARLIAGQCAVPGGIHSARSEASIGLNLEDRLVVAECVADTNIFTKTAEDALQPPELLDAEQRLLDAYSALRRGRLVGEGNRVTRKRLSGL